MALDITKLLQSWSTQRYANPAAQAANRANAFRNQSTSMYSSKGKFGSAAQNPQFGFMPAIEKMYSKLSQGYQPQNMVDPTQVLASIRPGIQENMKGNFASAANRLGGLGMVSPSTGSSVYGQALGDVARKSGQDEAEIANKYWFDAATDQANRQLNATQSAGSLGLGFAGLMADTGKWAANKTGEWESEGYGRKLEADRERERLKDKSRMQQQGELAYNRRHTDAAEDPWVKQLREMQAQREMDKMGRQWEPYMRSPNWFVKSPVF